MLESGKINGKRESGTLYPILPKINWKRIILLSLGKKQLKI
ncbi:MAG: hypothetical protein GF311_24885 [Candidatus Lokiarchaeota archaeon]|nr:hypothetical protein [Candidatus Lokiarchaeota archaeon]